MVITETVKSSIRGEISHFILENSNNIKIKISSIGGTILNIWVPDVNGKIEDVVLGQDPRDSPFENEAYFGSTVGRCANRIANGQFLLNNQSFTLTKNAGENCLHGGLLGFDKKIWRIVMDETHPSAILTSIVSNDGEEGFPGKLEVNVKYTLTDNNELIIDYLAISDKDTIINLTDHTYFNLNGGGKGKILDHRLQINASFYTPVNDQQIPTGEILTVQETPFDFKKFKDIGQDIASDNRQLQIGNGYDHNYVLGACGQMKLAAIAIEPESKRKLEVFTTEPGIQLYTGNFLNGIKGKYNQIYKQRSGFCLETQHFPNSPNHNHFPSVVLVKGKEFKSKTIYKFSIEK